MKLVKIQFNTIEGHNEACVRLPSGSYLVGCEDGKTQLIIMTKETYEELKEEIQAIHNEFPYDFIDESLNIIWE